MRRLKHWEKICGKLVLYLDALIPYQWDMERGWQENDTEYVEFFIVWIKMWWRPLNFPDQHTDRWKAYSVLVSEKTITRVEANKVPHQDCALPLNRETPDFTKLSNTLRECSYHKFWVSWWKTSQVLHMLICCVSSLWKPSNAPRVPRKCLNGIFCNTKPAVIPMQSTA